MAELYEKHCLRVLIAVMGDGGPGWQKGKPDVWQGKGADPWSSGGNNAWSSDGGTGETMPWDQSVSKGASLANNPTII